MGDKHQSFVMKVEESVYFEIKAVARIGSVKKVKPGFISNKAFLDERNGAKMLRLLVKSLAVEFESNDVNTIVSCTRCDTIAVGLMDGKSVCNKCRGIHD